MLKGTRNDYVALGWLTFVVLIFVGALFISLSVQERRHTNERDHAAAEAQENSNERQPRCIGIPGTNFVLCSGKPASAENGDTYARQDLRAQQEMARWAFGMLAVTCASLLATVVGIFFVYRTLDAQRAANAQEREHFERENRAWLDVSFVVSEFMTHNETLWFTVTLTARNVGNSPATNVFFEVPKEPMAVFSFVELTAFREVIRRHKEASASTGETVFQGGERHRTGILKAVVAKGDVLGREFTVPVFVSYQIDADNKWHVTPLIIRVTITEVDFLKVSGVADHHPLSIAPD